MLASVEAHRPRGAQRTGTGQSGGPGTPANEERTFSFPVRGERSSLRQLDVTLVALPGGWTGVRADALEIWIIVRPAAEAVPGGTHEIDIQSASPRSRPIASLRVTDRAKIARIVAWINALGIVQGQLYGYPAGTRAPVVTIAFRGANGGVLARAKAVDSLAGVSGPCSAIEFSIRGHAREPALVGAFLPRVERLLRVRFTS